MARTVFMGTPAFAVPVLQALLAAPEYDLVGVLTQPDRRSGRGRKLATPPVKDVALQAGVLVQQPEHLRDRETFAQLAELQPELIVVAAFGQILRPNVLTLPRYGCINVHASLLPRWRGASPITAALLAGDAITGSTIMLMDEGMDTGPILAQAEYPIQADDTTGTLSERLAQHGADLLLTTLPSYLGDAIEARAQEDDEATYCKLIKKHDALIDWHDTATAIERMVRAYQPWPGAYTTWEGNSLKIGRADVVEGSGLPGQVVAMERGAAIGCGENLLAVEELQLAGKKMIAIEDFLRGRPEFIGARLG